MFAGGPSSTYNMANGNISTCSGTLYDNGGTGNYTNGQNLTYTICPSTAGNVISLNFSAFNLENNFDFLYIYNGGSSTDPLIGSFTSSNSPGIVTSSAANGCLTLVFTSDGSVTSTGWQAAISCTTPPPTGSNINMTNGSGSACGGTFYDSGGSAGAYGNSQSLVYTLCPSTSGSQIALNFTSFDLENNYDFLEIFDGDNVNAPSLGAYTGTAGPGNVQATPSNASGCITFRFTSDGSVTAAGWAATISCTEPCQTITANFNSSNPVSQSGIIQACPGDNVSFSGSGTFSDNGAGATYTWDFGDGSTASGTNVNHTFSQSGSYIIDLTVEDTEGCTNSNSIDQIVQISTEPTFSGTASPATICVGETTTLDMTVTPVPFVVNCTPPVAGTTFLPDGSGVSYTTSIDVDCFSPGQTITSGNQIGSICLDIEHSFLGDLSIELICPNGQSITLKEYPGGGGTFLGQALDDGGTGPGVGAVYCFTPSATTLLVNGSTTNVGTPPSASIVPGNYMSVDSFNGLIGCPANGSWTIQVTDNLSIDNGYIFAWDMNFSSSLVPISGTSFTPAIVSESWQSASGLTNTGSGTATFTPNTTGNQCFTYEVLDDFGCTYTDQLCVNVTSGVTPTFNSVGPYCYGQTIPALPTTSTNGITGTWSPAINNTATTTYTFTPNAGQCAGPVTLTITITQPPPPAVACYETATWNATSCDYDVTGTQPPPPAVACYETATWNATSCDYDVTGTQPPPPAVACYETATWNATSCDYDVTGTQPPPPAVACYETATWNATTCDYDVTGTQPPPPAVVNCWDDYQFNTTTCAWENQGSQDPQPPVVNCWDDYQFNTVSCTWENQGVPPGLSVNSTLSTIDLSQNSVITATGSPLGGTYSWTPSTGLDVTTGSVVNASPPSTTTYTVTYDIGGCTLSETITIAVNSLTMTVNSETICSGGNTTLTATPSVLGGSYLWSPGGQTTQSITVSPTSNSIYTCVYTLNGVSTSPTIGVVTVNQTPTVGVNSGTICSGQSANLSATAAPSGGSYLWSPGGETTSSITVSPMTTTTYTVTYTLNGCSDVGSGTITVNPTPTVSVNSETICAGGSTNLVATAEPLGGTYLWTNSQTTSIITVSPSTTTSYNVLYTLNGCNATGGGTVTVNAIPTVSVDNQVICEGDQATLTATPSTGGGSYVWTGDPSTTNTITVNPTTTTSYNVVYTLNNCSGQSSSGTVTVNPIPTVSVNNQVICEGETAQLVATPSQPGGDYVWSPGGEITNSITITPTLTTSYDVVYTLNGCASTVSTGTVTVNPLPVVSFVADTALGCAPFMVTLTSTTANGEDCIWDLGNGQTGMGCSITYTFMQGGCYDIGLTTSSNGCTSSATITDMICVEEPPVASFISNVITFTEPIHTVTFTNNSIGANSYFWDFGNGATSTDEDAVYTFSNTSSGAVITLTAVSTLGCIDETQISIDYEISPLIYVPNTFTPDGDNYNQVFTPIFTTGFDPYNFEMLIFNRWGEIVFESHDATIGWDGSYGNYGNDVQEGVYTWKIIYKNPQNDKREILVGHVTLIK